MSFWSAVSAVASKASEALQTLGGEQYDSDVRCHDRDRDEVQHAPKSNSSVDLEREHLLVQRVRQLFVAAACIFCNSCCSALLLLLHGQRKHFKNLWTMRVKILFGLSQRVYGGMIRVGNGVCGMFRSALACVRIFYQVSIAHTLMQGLLQMSENLSHLHYVSGYCYDVRAAVYCCTSGVHSKQNEVRSLLAHLFPNHDQVGYWQPQFLSQCAADALFFQPRSARCSSSNGGRGCSCCCVFTGDARSP